MKKIDESKYYNGSTILGKKDLNGEIPNIVLVTSNRSAGKTFYFLKKSLEDFNNSKDSDTGRRSKFGLLYRYKYELSACSRLFDDILKLYPKLGHEVTAESRANGLFYEIFLDDESCGFAFALNTPDPLKKYSPLFGEVDFLIMDEVQLETGAYLKGELDKLQSVYTTIARGGGEQSRKVRLVLLSNYVSIMNPYYIQFGIHKRLKDDTKFMRGDGWVAEFNLNTSASEELKKNSFYRAFGDSNYLKYSTEKVYLVDNSCFIEKPSGNSRYLFTIRFDGINYGVRDYGDYLYVSESYDPSSRFTITFKASDHDNNTQMFNRYSYLTNMLKASFNSGNMRFDGVKSKNVLFDVLAIDVHK